MNIVYIDAFSGISGDMTVGALLDAGADRDALLEGLGSLNTGAAFEIEKTRRRGIAATKFRVHGGEQKKHRHLPHILDLIERSGLPVRAKRNAAAVFQKLGEAEARAHGIAIEKVHFHEVGAVDSICDIAGACLGFELLEAAEIRCSAINTGSGTVNTEHGVLPVPAPATAFLLEHKPVYARGPAMELTTPTGAAIVAALAADFGPMPPMRIAGTGYGAGDREFTEHANVLRVMVGTASGAAESTTVAVIEANIDDSTPALLGYAMEQLFASGALDVTFAPVQMKKNRPGVIVTVVARPEDQERLASVLFAETTTLGVRIYSAERRVQSRSIVDVALGYGSVRVKVGEGGGFAPEFEDCRELAQAHNKPLKQVLADANLAYLKKSK